MPIYVYYCSSCERSEERHAPVEERNEQRCHACHGLMGRDLFAEQKSARGDYDSPIYSEAAGVMPDQVAEHRRTHPDIPVADDGRVIFTSHSQRKRALRKLGMVDRDGFD